MSTDSTGAQVASLKYLPFGETRASTGTLGTDKKFTGQRLDGTGLYFYNARYYDPSVGKFISADSVVPDFTNPQALNRYAYVLNNPLRYTDATGYHHREDEVATANAILYDPVAPADAITWALSILQANDFEHQAEKEYGGMLQSEPRETLISGLLPGSVILVTQERTTIQVLNPEATDLVVTIMDFPGEGAQVVRIKQVGEGTIPMGRPAWTPFANEIQVRSLSKMDIALLVHESEHVEQRPEAGGPLGYLGNLGWNIKYLFSHGSIEAAAKRVASPPRFWVVVPRPRLR